MPEPFVEDEDGNPRQNACDREGVAEHVWMGAIAREFGGFRGLDDDLMDALTREPEDPLRMRDACPRHMARQFAKELRPQRNRSDVTAPLEGPDPQDLAGKVDRIGDQSEKLGHADAGLPHHVEDHPIPRSR